MSTTKILQPTHDGIETRAAHSETLGFIKLPAHAAMETNA